MSSLTLTLDDLLPGDYARIQRHHAEGAVRQRLMDLGLMPDTLVEMIRTAPLGDPIELRLGDSSVVLRRREASSVEVRRDV
jgi:ferrous iron transport protein A